MEVLVMSVVACVLHDPCTVIFALKFQHMANGFTDSGAVSHAEQVNFEVTTVRSGRLCSLFSFLLVLDICHKLHPSFYGFYFLHRNAFKVVLLSID